MPKKNEKAHRKELLHALRDQNRQATREQFPVGAPVLKGLFDFLDSHLSDEDCNDTLRFTREFISSYKLPEESLVAWLEKNGGHCDCEALNNVEQIVEDAIPEYRDLRFDPSPAQ